MIDVFSLSRLVGGLTLQKGLDYSRRGAVVVTTVTEDPLRILGQVQGGGIRPYVVSVTLRLDGPSVVALTGICSCPVHMNCKHVAALVISGLSRRGEDQSSAPPSWERMLTPLVRADEDEVDPSLMPIGLQFELMAAVGETGPRTSGMGLPTAARLGIRPVQQGAAGRWVRTGIGWSSLGYSSYGRARPDPAHLDWLSAVLSVAVNNSSRYYGSVPAWIQLESVTGTAVWDLLGRADELGVTLIGSDRHQHAVTIAAEPAELVLDVVRTDEGLAVAATLDTVTAVNAGGAGGRVMLGAPVRALASWPTWADALPLRERPLVVTPFKASPSRELLALAAAGPQQIPARDEARFLGTYLPVLRQRVRLVSSNDTFEVPAPVPPQLWLTIARLTGHRVTLRWAWRYDGADGEQPLWPQFQPAAYRDLVLEHAVVDALPAEVSEQEYLLDRGRLVGETTLLGMQAIQFLAGVLPLLAEHPGLQVEVVGEANYRAAEGLPVIGISGEPGEGRDWFDLQIVVSVDGEEVPIRDIFVALATGQDFMILPSGTYFTLEAERFEQLRRLIDEARQLQDPGEKGLRVSRFQASLWDELRVLGVVDEQAAQWHRRVSALLEVTRIERQALPEHFAATLRPYQQDGFDWLMFLFDAGLGGILADDMGLGKTVQALALISAVVARPAGSPAFLVVAPTSVVGNWKSEATRFAPHLKTVTINETHSRRRTTIADLTAEADIVITSYALFRLEFDDYQEQEWAGLILDEAQFVKNHQSIGFKNAKKLSTGFKLAITGTPMENNLMELWSLFSITAPGLFGSPTRFADYYQKPIERYGEQDRLSQLRRRIRPLMLRRNKEQVVKELPPKQEQVIELELNPRHQKVYQTHLQRERQKVLGLIGDLDKNRFVIFRSLTLLRQLSLDASLVDEKYGGIPSTKLDALMEQLEDVVAEGHRVLVFSQFTSFLAKVRTRLELAGVDHCYLDGRTRRRAEVLDRFSTGTAPVFLISLKAGGFGLNLTEADYCILLDPWWNPATEAQAIDRAHRIGQLKTVMVYRLVAKGTIEEKVMALKESKAKLFSSVMSDDGAASSALTADDIRSLLS
ncbi:superfamily II DNA or RNA helicase [Nakamurella sp. UYEF19]|uniref:DEAD/DEAH box helicase n=1 Tax=Nakamurella sp. UYEF19 TaxID=1756392 RepID=UPI00339163FF